MLRRQFHSASVQAFKQKTAGSSKKTRTPAKGKEVEHRNFRKAAAYSNYQKLAPEVPNLKVLTAEQLAPGMYTYPDSIQASLIHSGSFPPQQNNELFRTHTSLFRQQSLDLAQSLENSRKLLVGPSGVGKTTMLSQMHAVAKINNWAVLHIPRAHDLIDGSTDHVANGDYYLQPMLVKRWFKSLLKANKGVFGPEATKILKSGDAASVDALFEQLNKDQTKVLFSIDGINSWSNQPLAVNRNKDNEQIYHGDLQLPKVFLEFMSGSRKLNGGAVIAATTGKYKTNSTIEVALGKGTTHGYAGITEFDSVLSDKLKAADGVEVSYLTTEEARAWVDYLTTAGVSPEASDAIVNERVSLSGGNPRLLLRSFINYSF